MHTEHFFGQSPRTIFRFFASVHRASDIELQSPYFNFSEGGHFDAGTSSRVAHVGLGVGAVVGDFVGSQILQVLGPVHGGGL